MEPVPDTAESADPALVRVGKALRERRLEFPNMTQKILADLAGVGLNTVALLERGVTFPREMNARKIERVVKWPSGSLTAQYKDGAPVPGPVDDADVSTGSESFEGQSISAARVVTGAGANQLLAITGAVGALAAASSEIAIRYAASDPEAANLVRGLDRSLLSLETLVAAHIPEADSFDEALNTLSELHRVRERVRDALAE